MSSYVLWMGSVFMQFRSDFDMFGWQTTPSRDIQLMLYYALTISLLLHGRGGTWSKSYDYLRRQRQRVFRERSPRGSRRGDTRPSPRLSSALPAALRF